MPAINIIIDPDTLQMLRDIAHDNKRTGEGPQSISQILRMALTQYLVSRTPKKGSRHT